MNEIVIRRRRRPLLLGALALSVMLVPVGGDATGATASKGSGSTAASRSCAGGMLLAHSRPYLTGFPVLNIGSPFYVTREISNAAATITVTTADICNQPVDAGQADYLTQEGSAQSGPDFVAESGQSELLCVNNHPDLVPCEPPHAPTAQEIPLTIINDSDAEAAVESFLFKLENGQPYPISDFRPTQAPVHIIDNEGSDRVWLAPTLAGSESVAYEAGEPSFVDIPVFWAGNGAPQSVHYTIGAGTPAPTPEVDYRVLSEKPLPATDFKYAGGRMAVIRLRILNNTGPDGRPVKELDEIITITLDSDPAYEVDPDHDSTTLTILDGGSDTIAPRTWFHHPKHKKRYRRNDYRVREMHIFYRERGGSGIQRAQLAISRKKRNGRCQWWTGQGWRNARCKGVPGKVWKRTKYDKFLDWFLYRVPAFKPTQRTNIRFYRAYARGFDHAGNVETRFWTDGPRGNKNKFWIKRR